MPDPEWLWADPIVLNFINRVTAFKEVNACQWIKPRLMYKCNVRESGPGNTTRPLKYGFCPVFSELSSTQHPMQIIPPAFCEDSSYSAPDWVILAAIVGLIGFLQVHGQSESEEGGSLGGESI